MEKGQGVEMENVLKSNPMEQINSGEFFEDYPVYGIVEARHCEWYAMVI